MMHLVFSRFRRSTGSMRDADLERKHKFISVRRKLITGIVCAVALVSLGRGMFEILSQTGRITAYLEKRSSTVKQVAAGLAASPLVFNDADTLKAMESLMADEDIAYLQVVDSAGVTRCELGSRSDDLLTYNSDINYRSYPIGQVNIGISQNRIHEVLQQELLNNLTSLGLTLVILVVLVSIIAHFVIAPMEALKSAVELASRGEYTARSNTHTNDEIGFLARFIDISIQKIAQQKAQIYQGYHDVLTGLYNRSFFEEELKRLDMGRQAPISIIMGDVNGLKLTNDVFGHDEGDNLLMHIASVLGSSCRADDIVARTGGDEFCILLPKTTADEAEEICQRIYNACAVQQTGGTAAALRLSISLGYATKEFGQRRLQSVLKAAEDSMYKRKLLESRSQHSSIVSTIRTTLNEKSHETEDHSYRLMNYARMVGMKAMLNTDQLSDLELLAVMHDIGKITVDDAVLNKAGPLTIDEWEQIKKHPEMGYRIASSSPELMTIANCILAHHECWDGKGYPQGLSGSDIPLLSRILSIVDSYDAMTQDRIYRKALSREAAIQELRRNAGRQFDPEIVEIFLQCIEEVA